MLQILFTSYTSTRLNTTVETLMIGEDNKDEQRKYNTVINILSINKEKEILGCNATEIDEDDIENQQNESEPLLAKNDQNATIKKIHEDKKSMVIKTGFKKILVNHIEKEDNNNILNGRTNIYNQENINSASVVLYNLPDILGNNSNCRLITLSLKHMLKTILVTSPIIIFVCLAGFCLSKVPYTNNCTKYSTDHDCIYYNKHLLIGVNQILRLVSALFKSSSLYFLIWNEMAVFIEARQNSRNPTSIENKCT